VQNYSLLASPATVATSPGSNAAVAVQLQPLFGYSGTVSLNCDATALGASICSMNPVGPFVLANATTVTTQITVPVPSGFNIAGSYPVRLTSADILSSKLTQSGSFTVNVQDYKLEASPGSAAISAGGSTTQTLTVTGLGGFGGQVSFTPTSCIGLPALSSCSFTPATVAATASGASTTLTIATTAPSLSQAMPGVHRGGGLFYALWLPLAGMALGFVSLAGAPRRRRTAGWIWLGLLVAALTLQMACGSGAGSGLTPPPPTPKPGTPGGTYSITVSGSATVGSATLQRSASVTLTVQ